MEAGVWSLDGKRSVEIRNYSTYLNKTIDSDTRDTENLSAILVPKGNSEYVVAHDAGITLAENILSKDVTAHEILTSAKNEIQKLRENID